jgi:hypothetical protein
MMEVAVIWQPSNTRIMMAMSSIDKATINIITANEITKP